MYLDWAMKFARRKAHSTDKWFPLSAELSKQKQSPLENNESVALPDGTFLSKNSLFVTFVGSFTRLFNFETVLRVARDLALSGNKDVQFLFVGDGEKTNDLRKRSKNLDNFHMTGWCEKATVDRLLGISSVGLAPYRPIVTPTLSNKPFEYMAAGIPILSSVEGELRTIIERESIGLHYQGDDPADLKAKILWFLLNPEERRVMGQKGRALLEEKYNADFIYPDFAEHLTRIAKIGVVNE
jgi:glycosyltransferase involved in cell wall biosynthesis